MWEDEQVVESEVELAGVGVPKLAVEQAVD